MLRILRDPIWQGIAAIVAIVAGIIAFMPKAEPCEEPIFQTVQDAQLCGSTEEIVEVSPATPKTCRRLEFGQAGYVHTQTVTQSSGWRGGGSNPTNWCNELSQSFINARSIGATAATDIVNTTEDARWTGTFGRTRQYNYGCTVRISWEPLYNERTDPVCGMNPAVTTRKILAKSCKKQIGTKEIPCT